MMRSTPGEGQRIGPVARSAAVYFGIVFSIGFLLGSVRVPFLVPRLGVRWAELAEMPVMLLAIFLAAGHVVRRHGAAVSAGSWALVGVAGLVLLICAELALASVLADRGIRECIAGRDPVSGSVYLGMLLVFAAMPWLRHRFQRA